LNHAFNEDEDRYLVLDQQDARAIGVPNSAPREFPLAKPPGSWQRPVSTRGPIIGSELQVR
jgi:hypothetical protein